MPDRTPLLYASHIPYPSVTDQPLQTRMDLWADVVEGRHLVFTANGAEFPGPPLMANKAAFAEQKVPSKRRVGIRYICNPRLQINSRNHSAMRPLLSVPTIPGLIRRILYWGRRYPDIPAHPCKCDVKSAFKPSPLSIGMILRDGARVVSCLMNYLGLYCGRKESRGNWGPISSLLMQFVAGCVPSNTHTRGPESFEAIQFVGDGGLPYRKWA